MTATECGDCGLRLRFVRTDVWCLPLYNCCRQTQIRELYLTSECTIELIESIEGCVDNVSFVRPVESCLPAVPAEELDTHFHCVYEFDMDSHTFLPLRKCFVVDRLPALPPSIRSPGSCVHYALHPRQLRGRQRAVLTLGCTTLRLPVMFVPSFPSPPGFVKPRRLPLDTPLRLADSSADSVADSGVCGDAAADSGGDGPEDAVKAFSSSYIGVSWHRASGRWHGQIRHMGKRLSLGYFHTEVEAARAYDKVGFPAGLDADLLSLWLWQPLHQPVGVLLCRLDHEI